MHFVRYNKVDTSDIRTLLLYTINNTIQCSPLIHDPTSDAQYNLSLGVTITAKIFKDNQTKMRNIHLHIFYLLFKS